MSKKILILGTGKVAKALDVIFNKKAWEAEICSLRLAINNESEIIEKCKNADVLIYAVGNTQVVRGVGISEYIYDNCMVLAWFIKTVMLSMTEKQFIFFSSAKVYNMMNESEKLNESEINSGSYNAEDVDNICNILMDNRKTEEKDDELLCFGRKHKQYLYEYCKIICEKLIYRYVSNYTILRPTYLYGKEETDNYIYKSIKNAIIGDEMIEAYQYDRDFVEYSYLEEVIEHTILTNYKGILNISTGRKISYTYFEKYLKVICDICGKKIKISNDLAGTDSKSVLPEKINRFEIAFRTFEEAVNEIMYRLYIQEIKKLNIIDEYCGGSYARVYKVENLNGVESIVKIAFGNGANNGAQKLFNEINHILSLKQNKKTRNLLPEIYDVVKRLDFVFINREIVNGRKFEDFSADDKRIYLTKYCKLVCSIYAVRKVDIKENMLTKNIMRIYERIEKVRELGQHSFTKNLFEYSEIIINGKVFKNPFLIFDKLRKGGNIDFCNTLGLCISGDAILDNAIFGENNIVILDQRGEDLLWIDKEPYFDPIYDLGKILFYFMGWKQIRNENFELKSENNIFELKFNNYNDLDMIRACKKIFLDCKYILQENIDDLDFLYKIYLMAGLHFLADSYPRLVGKGNKEKQCLAELLLGIQMINTIDNKRDIEELGVESVYEFNR